MEAGDRCRRRDGIRESTSDGISSLYWEVGDTRFVTTGADIEVLYDVVDRLQAIEPTADRGGYEFVGGLPAGMVSSIRCGRWPPDGSLESSTPTKARASRCTWMTSRRSRR